MTTKAARPTGAANLARQRRFWTACAASWDHGAQNNPGLVRVVEQVLHEADGSGAQRAVDLGCGSGQLTIPHATTVDSVVAVDISSAMIDLLADNAHAAGVTNIEGRATPIEGLDIAPESVDLVVSNYALHHLRDRDKAARGRERSRLAPPRRAPDRRRHDVRPGRRGSGPGDHLLEGRAAAPQGSGRLVAHREERRAIPAAVPRAPGIDVGVVDDVQRRGPHRRPGDPRRERGGGRLRDQASGPLIPVSRRRPQPGLSQPSLSHPSLGLGIDVGGTKVLGVVTTPDGNEIAVVRGAAPPNPTELARSLSALLEELLSLLGDRPTEHFGLGISVPGLVDSNGILHAAPNLGAPEVEFDLRHELAVPLAQMLPRGLDPSLVALDNDATAAAYGETTRGAGRGERNVLVISMGTGIGAGIVADGRVLRGERGYAGEFGHMIIDPAGPECPCGRRGCFERFASGSGLAFLARRAGLGEAAGSGDELRGEHVVERARAGDAAALAVIDELASYLAIGLSNAVEILDPSMIVLAGGLMTASDVLLQPIQAAFLACSRPAQRRDGARLVLAQLGEDAAAIGAALLGLEMARSATSLA